MEADEEDFLQRLKDLRQDAENQFDNELRAKTLVGLDQIISRISRKLSAPLAKNGYCNMQVNMSVSAGPAREDASVLAAQAAALVRSLGQDDSNKTDEASGRIPVSQSTMSVSVGSTCNTDSNGVAADAAAIVRALVAEKV